MTPPRRGRPVTVPDPEPGPLARPGRDRVTSLLERALRGPGAPRARALILAAVDDHTAAMIEMYARPPEHYWAPEHGEDGGAA